MSDPNSDTMSLAEHEQTYVHPESPAPQAPEPEPVSQPEPEPVAAEPTADAPADDEKPVNDPARGERDEHGRFKPREKHRAKSQHATAADVPRIAALTKKLREAEERAAKLEAQIPRAPAPKPEPPKEFTDAEPKYEDFANEADPYAAHMRALTAYDRKKELAEAAKVAHESTQKAEIEARNKQRDEWFQTRLKAHGERIEKLFTANPQAEAIIEKANVSLNPVMLAAVLGSDNSDQLALTLAQNPDLVDDLHLLTDDKSPSQDLVAYVQRRMSRGLKVANTGSTAPASVVPALPRPPNPVRTGAMKPADTPPGDDASLDEHERAYVKGGYRRR